MKNKKWWLIGCGSFLGLGVLFIGLIVVVVLFVANTEIEEQKITPVNSEGLSKKDNEKENKDEESDYEELFYIGDTVSMNNIDYIVNNIDVKETVAGYTSESGTYLIVNVTVQNKGNEAGLINNNDFKVLINDAEYENDPNTTAYHDGGFFLDEINPGLKSTASLVFEVPSNILENKPALQIKPNIWKNEEITILLEKSQ